MGIPERTDALATAAGPVAGPAGSQDLSELRGPLRRYVASLVFDQHEVDDIVQETLVRMWQVTRRLEVDALSAYAFAVARNLVRHHGRSQSTARRHLPRLLDLTEPARPEDSVVTAEARSALATALAALAPERRDALLDRDIHRRSLAELAQQRNVSPNVLASQLHRTRSVLRLDYLLALRRVTLPTPTCRPVLLALSGGDRRQQQSVRAGDHLGTCRTCAELAPPLLQRDRALAGLVPWIPLGALHGRIEGLVRAHPGTSVAVAGTATALAAAGVAVAVGSSAPTTPTAPAAATPPAPSAVASPGSPAATPSLPPPVPGPPPVPNVSVDGQPLVAEQSSLAAVDGHTVTATSVRVLAVPADEGFWVGADGARVWVELRTSGESPVQIRAGQALTFTGRVVPNAPSFLSTVGVQVADGRPELERDGFHLEVDPARVRVAG